MYLDQVKRWNAETERHRAVAKRHQALTRLLETLSPYIPTGLLVTAMLADPRCVLPVAVLSTAVLLAKAPALIDAWSRNKRHWSDR